MNSGNFSVNRAYLVDLAIKLRKGEIKMKDAAESGVVFDTIHGNQVIIPRSVSSLKRYFADNGIKVFEVGRKGSQHDYTKITADVVATHYDLKVGITKVWAILNKKGVKCSRKDVENIFREVIHPPKELPVPKIQKTRCRYLVDKVNGAWHGDIHYLVYEGSTKYMFALIDDRSRFIVGYRIFDFKTAENVKQTFIEIMTKMDVKPLIFWSDNGLENVAHLMKEFLRQENIEQVTTIPGNPQSNGKIEKFWSTLDRNLHGIMEWTSVYACIEKYVYDYNFNIPHTGLGKGKDGLMLTPAEVFYDRELSAVNLESTNIQIDNKGTIPLSEFVIKKHVPVNDGITAAAPNILSLENLLN